jgi:hypothetical protein
MLSAQLQAGGQTDSEANITIEAYQAMRRRNQR